MQCRGAPCDGDVAGAVDAVIAGTRLGAVSEAVVTVALDWLVRELSSRRVQYIVVDPNGVVADVVVATATHAKPEVSGLSEGSGAALVGGEGVAPRASDPAAVRAASTQASGLGGCVPVAVDLGPCVPHGDFGLSRGAARRRSRARGARRLSADFLPVPDFAMLRSLPPESKQ